MFLGFAAGFTASWLFSDEQNAPRTTEHGEVIFRNTPIVD